MLCFLVTELADGELVLEAKVLATAPSVLVDAQGSESKDLPFTGIQCSVLNTTKDNSSVLRPLLPMEHSQAQFACHSFSVHLFDHFS